MADMKGESLATASSLADLFLYGWDDTDDLKVPASLLGLATGGSPQLASIELGDATDTTLTRSAAGRLAVEGVNVALESGQLQFPATQNPSADPNNLDDYEENTWTPGRPLAAGLRA